MIELQNILYYLAIFLIIAFSSKQLGKYAVKIKLPLVSGFLITGIVTGPYVLNIISSEAVIKLRFLDELALGFIAFAAGAELFLEDLKNRARSITFVTASLVIVTFSLGSVTVYLFSEYIPFLSEMSKMSRVAISMLAASILIARSPSSAIAVIKELRAKGPFTQTALGVTVIMDVIVIFLFALNSSIVDSVLLKLPIDFKFVGILILELTLVIVAGILLSLLLRLILKLVRGQQLASILILFVGYSVFALSIKLREVTHFYLSFELFLEPLLICIIASFLVTNFSSYRKIFSEILHEIGPPIYIIFFTLTGASLALDLIISVWSIAPGIFVVRLFAIFIGSYFGGVLAGDRMRHNKYSWMSYVTQAGVGLGLAKDVAVGFPGWGTFFATMMISVIVMNQIVGPILFKFALHRVGETHVKGTDSEYKGKRIAVVFGIDGQSIALALQLISHHWKVKLITTIKQELEDHKDSGLNLIHVDDLSLQSLKIAGCNNAGAIVTMLSDDENFEIGEHVYEHFADSNLIVYLNDRANTEKFKTISALIVAPSTAIVSLLDHFVRSPSAASLLMGMNDHNDVIDIEVQNSNIYGLGLKDLHFPNDIIIISVKRSGKMLIVHDNIRFQVGDELAVIGCEESLEEVNFRLSGA